MTRKAFSLPATSKLEDAFHALSISKECAMAAVGIAVPSLAAETDGVKNDDRKANPVIALDEATCLLGEIELFDYTIKDCTQDDESVSYQSDSSIGASDPVNGNPYKGLELDSDKFLTPVVGNARHVLVDKLMEEARVIFDKTWTAEFTSCAGSAPTSGSPSRQGHTTSGHGAINKMAETRKVVMAISPNEAMVILLNDQL